MLASFAGMVTFGYFHPIVVLAVIQVGVYAATEPAGEVEWGCSPRVGAAGQTKRDCRAEPRGGARRHDGHRRRDGGWHLGRAVAPGTRRARWPDPQRVLSLAAHVLLLSWVFAAAGLAAGAFARRRGSAFAGCGGHRLPVPDELRRGRLEPAALPAALHPIPLLPGFAVANGTAPVAHDLGVLAAVTAVLIVIAFWRFERRTCSSGLRPAAGGWRLAAGGWRSPILASGFCSYSSSQFATSGSRP